MPTACVSSPSNRKPRCLPLAPTVFRAIRFISAAMSSSSSEPHCFWDRQRRLSGLNDMWCKCDQFFRVFANVVGIGPSPAFVHLHITPDCPTQLMQLLLKCGNASLALRIVVGQGHEHTNPPNLLVLLRVCGESVCP